MTKKLLEFAKIGEDRLHLDWISASEGGKFARVVTDYVSRIKELGPLNSAWRQRLEAIKNTVLSERIRRILGKEKVLTHMGNVYGERLLGEDFDRLLQVSLEDEYIKNWITLVIKERPMSVEEIDSIIKVGPRAVSVHVVELWKSGRVSLHGFEQNYAKFISLV
jgi:F420-non-reducing hydrogenase iron-sulfur subunit